MTEQTIVRLAEALGLSYCHPRYCGCGEESYLLFTRQGDADAGMRLTCQQVYDAIKMPDWVNGAPPDEVYKWAQHEAWCSAFLRDRMEVAGLRIFRRYE